MIINYHCQRFVGDDSLGGISENVQCYNDNVLGSNKSNKISENVFLYLFSFNDINRTELKNLKICSCRRLCYSLSNMLWPCVSNISSRSTMLTRSSDSL